MIIRKRTSKHEVSILLFNLSLHGKYMSNPICQILLLTDLNTAISSKNRAKVQNYSDGSHDLKTQPLQLAITVEIVKSSFFYRKFYFQIHPQWRGNLTLTLVV